MARTRKKVGRPPKLDEAKKKEIVAFISGGGSKNFAAKYVGVDTATVIREEQADEEFRTNLLRAEAENYKDCVANVYSAGKDDWRAAAWLLERKHHQEFGKRDKVEVEKKEVRAAGMDWEEAHEALAKRISDALGPSEN